MRQSRSLFAAAFSALLMATPINSQAQSEPFTVADGLFCATDSAALGLTMAEGTETFTIFHPAEGDNHNNNGAVLTDFKGTLFCMWQTSKKDEDAEDTYVAYSESHDGGRTWKKPMLLASVTGGYCTSGGWLATNDSLVAYINIWDKKRGKKQRGEAYCMTTADGETWSKIRPVMMLNGKPMNAIIEQDLHVLPSGRIVGAAHFMPNLVASCIYSDSPLGINGWVKGHLSESEKPSFATSNAIEPSLFRQKDGTLVMVFRDQNSSFRKLASVSHDEGEHWTKPALTVFPDSRSKQSAGNLPDGTAYFVSNPVGYKQRVPLVLSLSRDTRHFNRAFVLRRGGSQLPPRRYEGRYKTIGYSYPKTIISGAFIMTSYSTNKEDIEITRVPLSSLKE